MDPPKAPNPSPKANINFPNWGTRQILNGINGFGTRDSTNTNSTQKTTPMTRQKIIHHVFHRSGALLASLQINITLPSSIDT